MGYRDNYEAWLRDFAEDEATVADLKAIAGDEKEIEDRFYKNLSFGTAGMRGVLGAGMNRMNVYTVRRATQGLADYLSGAEKQRGGSTRTKPDRNQRGGGGLRYNKCDKQDEPDNAGNRE